jgi:hypothetical protein
MSGELAPCVQDEKKRQRQIHIDIKIYCHGAGFYWITFIDMFFLPI